MTLIVWYQDAYPITISLNRLSERASSNDESSFTVFFTGLSGSGKSTLANALVAALKSLNKRSVT